MKGEIIQGYGLSLAALLGESMPLAVIALLTTASPLILDILKLEIQGYFTPTNPSLTPVYKVETTP